MTTNVITAIFFSFLFLILFNFLIHYHYKNKRKLLYAQIGNKDFIEIKDVEIEIYGTTKASSNWKFFKADLILFENTLIILLSRRLNGLITQNKPLIQICKEENTKKQPGVDRIYTIEKMKFNDNKIYLYSSVKLIINGKIEIILDFKEVEQLNAVKEYLK